MSPVWSVLIILGAAAAAGLVYALIVGGEIVRGAFVRIENERERWIDDE